MMGVLRLMRRDIAHATRNTMAIVVLVGLTILPSLFTWFNVIASWNPFGDTKNITVAVANADEGYKSDLFPVTINIGDQVVSALRANNDFNWVVTDEDKAIDGTKSAKYYAAIVMPKDFSKDMLTFYADGGERTAINYYINEKKNALAPKITGQGADMVSTEINKVFTETLSEIAVGILSDVSDYLDSGDTQVMFAQFESHVAQAATQLRAAASTATVFSSLMESNKALVTSAGDLISGTSVAMKEPSAAIGQAVSAASSLKTSISDISDELSDAISKSAQGIAAVGTKADAAFEAATGQTEKQAKAIDALGDMVQSQIDAYKDLESTLQTDVEPTLPDDVSLDLVYTALDNAISRQETVKERLDDAAQAIRSGNTGAEEARTALQKAVAEAHASIDNVQSKYVDSVKANLDQLASTLNTAVSAVGVVGSDLDSSATAMVGAADSISAKLTKAGTAVTKLASELTDAADTFDKLEAALKKASSAGDFSALQDVIGADPETLASSLASPVGLERHAVFPVDTFGSAMAPLYTVLALWVGALLMSVTITVAVPRGAVPGQKELTNNQKYFGRYGLFGLVGLAQSTVLGLGNLVFVGVQSVHPFLYVVAGWVTSLVFTFLIYTAVVAFGNAGKALGVLFLVIQISGAGAAYPLQLLPTWFQHISKFLPATYAVEAYRAAIAGIYNADYWQALGMLLLFLIPALILGLWLRKPLINFNRGISEALESTRIM
ncbi:MAG: YhgE/Pip domain-containing protein [Ancrocorticia sp.]|jgi:putative membrane protein|nr:YhgE/Pip domain-containing protein [Ancrocorticia sp.]